MLSPPRYCQLKNHETNETQHICTYIKCNNPIRLLCIECHRQQLHNHGPRSQQLILTLENFRMKYGSSVEASSLNKRKVDFICFLKALQQIEQNIQECNDKATQYLQFLTKIQQIFEKLDQNVNFLSNEQLDNLINIQQEPDFSIFRNTLLTIIIQTQKQVQFIDQMNYDFVQAQVQRQEDISILQSDPSIDVQQNVNKIQDHKKIKVISERQLSVVSDLQQSNQLEDSQIMESMKKSKIKINTINQQLQQQKTKMNDFVEVFYHHQDKIINSSAISQNEQYFAFAQNYTELKVLNFQNKNVNLAKSFKYSISVIRFSKDSQHIFVGDREGLIEYFIIESCIENILVKSYSSKIHKSSINNIIFLNQQQILTCSDDRSLIITDYKQFKQILKIENAHSAQIYGLDYDYMKDIIVSSSKDKSILFYNKAHNFQIFRNQKAHNYSITQITLLKEGMYLLSTDYEYLKHWEINYEKNQIQIINSFPIMYEKNQIINSNKSMSYFTVSNGYSIYLITIKQIIILDLNFHQIQKIQTEFVDFKFIKRVNQTFSQLYLINQSDTHIQVLIKRAVKQ